MKVLSYLLCKWKKVITEKMPFISKHQSNTEHATISLLDTVE